MQEERTVLEMLNTNEYLLMTTVDGSEVYDENGNLLLYHKNGSSILAVPNTAEVRRLYDLPLLTPEIKTTIKQDDVSKPGSLLPVINESEQFVWSSSVGNHHSKDATKMLIELYDSPKYQTLMQNPLNIKRIVWEKIASELEANGFKIASNSKEAGLKVRQKWKNMEKSYWNFVQNQSNEDPEQNKPYYFDDMHAIMSKYSLKLFESCYDNVQEPDEDNGPEEVVVKPVIKRKRLSDQRPANETFPSQALALLTSLVSLPKYKKLLSDQSIPNKSKVWESIYKEMSKAGWKFGTNSKEGGVILAEKWRVVERLVLKRKSFKQRTLFTQDFRKALRIEIENRKARGSNYESPPPSPSMSQYAICRKPKSGEISPEAIELLLNLIQTDKYNNRFSKGSGKRTNRMWEELYDDIHTQGLDVDGKTKQEKVSRLFQKWRNMKRTFVKYMIEKYNGKDIRKPMFFEQMFNILSKQISNKYESECESEDDVKANELQEGSDSECSVDFMELDHSYGQYNVTSDVEESVEASGNIVLLPSAEPSTSNAALSLEVLQQIKSLNETQLAMQQQYFTKMTSLLDSLVNQQSRLTSVVSDYILSQSVRSRSKSRHKT